jgi:hypothetical protein
VELPDPETAHFRGDNLTRREIITVRGQSYVSRLPNIDPPPFYAFVGGGGGRTHSPGGEGVGGQYFGRRDT